MLEMFISYCQKDSIYADYIDLYFKYKEVTIHRDIRNIFITKYSKNKC